MLISYYRCVHDFNYFHSTVILSYISEDWPLSHWIGWNVCEFPLSLCTIVDVLHLEFHPSSLSQLWRSSSQYISYDKIPHFHLISTFLKYFNAGISLSTVSKLQMPFFSPWMRGLLDKITMDSLLLPLAPSGGNSLLRRSRRSGCYGEAFPPCALARAGAGMCRRPVWELLPSAVNQQVRIRPRPLSSFYCWSLYITFFFAF